MALDTVLDDCGRHVYSRVTCDAPGCASASPDSGTSAHAIGNAEAIGWVLYHGDDDLDLCPDHAPEPKEPDGECYRGGEAAGYEREQMDAARRLK